MFKSYLATCLKIDETSNFYMLPVIMPKYGAEKWGLTKRTDQTSLAQIKIEISVLTIPHGALLKHKQW